MEGSIGSTVQHLLFDGDGLFVSGFDKIVETFYDRITHAEGTRNGSLSGGDEEQNLLMWKLRGSLGHHFRICGNRLMSLCGVMSAEAIRSIIADDLVFDNMDDFRGNRRHVEKIGHIETGIEYSYLRQTFVFGIS